MTLKRTLLGMALIVGALMPTPSYSQVTTAVVTGTVRDEQGAVIPGAMVALISSARGTRVAETETNESGDFVFPNVPGDTYIVEVTGAQPMRSVQAQVRFEF